LNLKNKLLLFFLLLFILVAAAVVLIYQFNLPPDGWDKEEKILIEEGMTVSSIGRDLESLGLIRSYYLFRIYHEIFGRSHVIPTGSYTLSPGTTTIDLYNKLVSGKQDMISITIPEGWPSRSIAERLDEYGICDEEEFLVSLTDSDLLSEYEWISESFEGFLFPDTYQFVYNESPSNVVRGMVDNFFINLGRIYSDWKDLTPSQISQKVIMASIVEKEYRLPEEAPLIASVFYNRLESDEFPFLQSCATVVYVITEIQKKPHPDRLFYRDLDIENSYNTYWAEGLPPGPIANPGYTAINAAFNPADTDYYFFVVKDSRVGSHNFSNNYNDFLSNKDYFNSFRSK
jgi:UPF0755 protein